MRIGRTTKRRYGDFWAWLWDDGNMIFLFNLGIAYLIYLLTTEEAS